MSRPHPSARMQDPAGGVPPQLLPHMHLVSSYRYPATAAFTHETAVEYLLSAPKVVRELQPMHWTYLDGPPDNTVMLTWQPLNHLGTNFASDGYVWADVEQAYTVEVRGYILEIYMHRTGYHPPNENMATHSRRRFRLTGMKTPNPGLPQCDPSLWIVFYSKTPSIDQLPAARIPVSPQTQNILGQRRYIQSQGQLSRKEFMLHDRNSWPTINLPPHPQQQMYPQAAYAVQAQMLARQQQHQQLLQQQQQHHPQHIPSQHQMVYPGMQAKMARVHRGPIPGIPAVPDFSLDEEEVSTGDILDALTPRDISRMRYRNHHEWMEEIFSSPYRMDQILPVDLGLGRKGELESLTKNFFYTPGALISYQKDIREGTGGPPAASGKMDTEKAEDFTSSVAKKLADMNAEMESMRKKHARKLEKTKKLSALREAELQLRDASMDPSDVGEEFWRVEGRLHLEQEDGMTPVDYSERQKQQTPKKKVDDIVQGLQASWGRAVVPVTDIKCLEKGGLQERVKQPPPPPPPPQQQPATASTTTTSPVSGESSMNMPPTAQYTHHDAGSSSHGATTPMQGVSTSAAPPSAPAPLPSAQAAAPSAPPQAVPAPQPTAGEDIVMGDAGVDSMQQSHGAPPPPVEADWVVVSKDSPAKTAAHEPNVQQPELTAASNGGGTNDFEDPNINTAGEALADYPGDDDMGDLDNSAFGDAFHATEGDRDEHHHEDEI